MVYNLEKKVARYCIKTLGSLYLKAEKFLDSPVEKIMGVGIDEDLQQYNREELCGEFDKHLGVTNQDFYKLPSTTKIRLGVQVMRNYEHEKEAKWDQEFRRKLKDKKGCRYEEKKWPKEGHSGL